jgi:quercetin dioxygenase-like cupin family protein
MGVQRRTLDEAEVTIMPGRIFHTLIAPWSCSTTLLSVGLSVYPPGSKPEGHRHPQEEETIYCVAGHGYIVADGVDWEMSSGTVVHVPPNTFHATVSDGPTELQLLCVFTPPVRPGTYEKAN